jgi:hypothetical protein
LNRKLSASFGFSLILDSPFSLNRREFHVDIKRQGRVVLKDMQKSALILFIDFITHSKLCRPIFSKSYLLSENGFPKLIIFKF